MIAIVCERTPAEASLRHIEALLLEAGESVEWVEALEPTLSHSGDALEPAVAYRIAGYTEWWMDRCPPELRYAWMRRRPTYAQDPIEAAASWFWHFARLFAERPRASAVVTWGSLHLITRAAIEAAEYLGVRAAPCEEGLFREYGDRRTFMVDRRRVYYEGPQIQSAMRVSRWKTCNNRLDDYRAWWLGTRSTKTGFACSEEEPLPDEWENGDGHTVVFGQVPWDASMWASDTDGALCAKMLEDAAATGAWYKPHPLYPAEHDGLRNLPTGVSVHSLLPKMAACASVCSNACNEAALAGIPSAQYGAPRPPGFAYSLETLSDWDQSAADRWLDYLIHDYQASESDPERLARRIKGEW